MDRARKLLYSDFFARLQSAQDLLAERLGICLVLVDREGKEMTLPSGLPLVCYEHENACFGCLAHHAALIAKLSPKQPSVMDRCPYDLWQVVLETSIRTDDGLLCLLAGRTRDAAPTEDHLALLESIYTLPFETPHTGKRAPALAKEPVSAHASLTAQENKVLACLVSGLSNKDIASQLCISQSTVKAHVANILKKLNLSNRTEASVYALKNGISSENDGV